MIKKASEISLKVRPIALTIEHRYYYEGPCRFSPDGGKMMVGRGTIVGGDGYALNNCNGLVIFRVKDQMDFWTKQNWCGNHLALVYGDYTRELSRLYSVLGVEELAAY